MKTPSIETLLRWFVVLLVAAFVLALALIPERAGPAEFLIGFSALGWRV